MPEYKWCAIDAEGDVGNLGLVGVSFFSDEGGHYLTDPDEIKELLLGYAREGYTFIAHNAEYDLGVIFWQLDLPMKAVYFNGRFNRGEWRYDPDARCCQLWDTLGLSGGMALWQIGKAIGLEKYKTPQRLTGRDPNRYEWICEEHDIGECAECYAIRDAEICYHFMTSLTDMLVGWGVEPHRRLSGLAAHVWRALDNPQPIGITSNEIRKLARDSYHGGRTETFKLGTVAPCYTSDVTSMYPAVMLESWYPDPDTMIYVTDTKANGWLNDHEGVADVDIHIPPMYVPPLPYTGEGKLKYPIGNMRGCWTLLELRYAVSLGCTIKHVHRAAYSVSSVRPFVNFVNTLWTMRGAYQASNDPRHLFAKLLMNNLYGYLGMRDELARTDITPADFDTSFKRQPKSGWYSKDGKLFLTYERPQPHRNKWTNALWAAQTTAAARVKLHQLMVMQGSALLYCDTDSIFSMLPIAGLGEGLGQLRQDGDYMAATISAPKLYALQDAGGTWWAKSKGVQRSVALKFLRDGVASFNQPIRPLSQARRRLPAGTWVEITRHQRSVPSRRHPLDVAALERGDGWSDTAPLYVGPSADFDATLT